MINLDVGGRLDTPKAGRGLLGLFPDRTAVVARDTPMIGEKAALARYRITVTMISFGLSMLLLVAVGLIAAPVRNSAIETVAYLMLVPPFGFIVGRFWLRHTYFRFASEATGILIRTQNDVPVSREGYERWWVKNGATPYSIKSGPE